MAVECFLGLWLLRRSISEQDITKHIKGQKLDLRFSMGHRMPQDSRRAYQEALELGLPPLPKEARNFSQIYFRQKQQTLESKGFVLRPEPGTSFWGNLSGSCYDKIWLSLADMSFREGLNDMRCKKLELKSMSEDSSFDDMPRLVGKDGLAELSIKECPDAVKLADTLADYLGETQANRIKLRICDSPGWDMKPEVFEAIFDKFEGLDMTIRNSVQQGFLESYPKAIDKIRKKLEVIPKCSLMDKEQRDRRAARGKLDFTVDADVPPFRRCDVFLQYDLPVYWPKEGTSYLQEPNPGLVW